jgi:hypothetical protein
MTSCKCTAFCDVHNPVWRFGSLEGRRVAVWDESCGMQAAMKLINAALVKYPGNISLRSLKAHALERSGNFAEAVQVCVPPTLLSGRHTPNST